MIHFMNKVNSPQVYFHFNYILLLAVFSVLLMFSSCREKEEMEVPTIDDEEIVVVDPCPYGKYNGIVVSYQDNRADIDALGASIVHSWFQWDLVEENLTAPFITEAQVTEEMVEKYASGEKEGIDWTRLDDHVNEYEGLELIMGIGSGWINSLPLYNGEKITPDIIGHDEYIGQIYLHTRACVRRYKDKVSIWQIENEPNISDILITLGHREGNSWNDDEFMTRVLNALERAVKAEDDDALTTINFFIDVNNYLEDINRWSSIVDIIGVDSYQDIFTPDPLIAADAVLDKLQKITDSSNEKPVMILETGYSSGPENSNFSEENQKIFIQEVFTRMDDVNACGAMYFKHISSEESSAGLFPSKHYRGLIKADNTPKLAWYFLRDFFE